MGNGQPQGPQEEDTFPVMGLPLKFTFMQQQIVGQDGPSTGLVMILTTPVGTNKYLMPGQAAEQFFTEGQRIARACKAGLILPDQS